MQTTQPMQRHQVEQLQEAVEFEKNNITGMRDIYSGMQSPTSHESIQQAGNSQSIKFVFIPLPF